jgi:hypothetical protein
MLDSSLRELRAEAKAAGLRWAHVAAASRELRAAEIAKREPLDRARCLAWRSYCHWAGRAPSCLSFWRCGFDHVLGRLANSGRDYTRIRNYDLVASSVAEELPEWEDRCNELWEFLATSYEPLPSAEEFLPRALECLVGNQLVDIGSQHEEF